MISIEPESGPGIAGKLHDALDDAADDLQDLPEHPGHNRKITLAVVAGGCFLLGFLWAKARSSIV